MLYLALFYIIKLILTKFITKPIILNLLILIIIEFCFSSLHKNSEKRSALL